MSRAPRFQTLLVANRGEIAVRILRTAQDLGYRTVAVYSDADRDAPHVGAADVAVHLGPAPARDSYLAVDRLLDAAADSGAEAIHPGYGFLSENAGFAEACRSAGITFVGPDPDAIRLMGDKAAAKRRMADAGVPLLPGYEGEEQDDDRLLAEAAAIGVPLMVKAAAGGGGKGMRLVEDLGDLPDAIAAARREASAAFGSDALILERALQGPRHVEIQVLADEHGHVIALGERDCSIQRRHQKVIEEAPSPAVDAATRQAMQAAAVRAATDIDYVGAGTVEFLLDEDGTFAFLEMNTRLQVEHPVTELVTGLDLVAWQLRIAQGEALTIAQDDVRLEGHAIEARVYAEDPDEGYLPQTGAIHLWEPPEGTGIRVDAGIRTGSDITAHYDPMLVKIVAHGRDREEARRRLADALDRTVLLGVTTNRTFLARALRHPTFVAGEATTAFLTETDLVAATPDATELAVVAAARMASMIPDGTPTELVGWTNAPWLQPTVRLRHGTAEHAVRPAEGPVDLDVTIHHVGRDRTLARFRHVDLDVTDVTHVAPDAVDAVGAGILVAPMHGTVTAVAVVAGDRVAAGDPVIVIEAMKMEHVVRADVAGSVTEVATEGTQVTDRQVLARIATEDQG